MIGFRTEINGPDKGQSRGILNVTAFADVSHSVTLGLESDYEGPVDGVSSLRLMPQVHLETGDRYMLQAGAGALWIDNSAFAEIAARFVVEL